MFDIAYICSDYNVASLNTSIDSIIEALATKSKVNFHIIDLGIAQEHKEKLALKLSKHHKNDWQFFNENKKDLFSPYLFFRGGGGEGSGNRLFNLFFHKPTLDEAMEVRLQFYKEHFYNLMHGLGTMYKLFLHNILSKLDLVLYLNFDVRAKGDIGKIFKIDMGDCFAVVSKYNAKNKILENDSILNYMVNDDYINEFCKVFNRVDYFDSGMMLLNLSKMRENDMNRRFYENALKYKHSKNGHLVDTIESVLNVGFNGNVKFSVF